MEYEIVEINIGDSISSYIIGTSDDDSQIAIPFDEANSDYQAYLAWCEEQETPTA